MPVQDAKAKAKALYEARRSRVPIPPFTDEDPSLGMADGYAIQKELVPLLLADGDRIVGYKVGVTSAAMQRLIDHAGRRVLRAHWTGDLAELSDLNLKATLAAAAFFLPGRMRRKLRRLGRGQSRWPF